VKVVLTGGGTAGHVNPALSIGAAIKNADSDNEIYYIGTEKGIEGRLVPHAGIKLYTIEVSGLKRSLSPANIKVLWQSLRAVSKCKKIFMEIRPDALVGTGGYVTWAPSVAAASLGIPVFLHEANAEPGFAVKRLKNTVHTVFMNFEKTSDYLSGAKAKLVHAGMPVSDKFRISSSRTAKKALGISDKYKLVILSFGGSLGAKRMNEVALDFISSYLRERKDIFFVHVTGKNGYSEFSAKMRENGLCELENLRVFDYIYNMPEYMASADLVICRSGASTIAELACAGKPSILIPSPNVTNDQQFKNAKLLADKKAAVLIRDAELVAGDYAKHADRFIEDRSLLDAMSERVKKFSVDRSDLLIYNYIKDNLK